MAALAATAPELWAYRSLKMAAKGGLPQVLPNLESVRVQGLFSSLEATSFAERIGRTHLRGSVSEKMLVYNTARVIAEISGDRRLTQRHSRVEELDTRSEAPPTGSQEMQTRDRADDPNWITGAQASDKYLIPKSTLTKYAARNPGSPLYLHSEKHGRHRYFRVKDIESLSRTIAARRSYRSPPRSLRNQLEEQE